MSYLNEVYDHWETNPNPVTRGGVNVNDWDFDRVVMRYRDFMTTRNTILKRYLNDLLGEFYVIGTIYFSEPQPATQYYRIHFDAKSKVMPRYDECHEHWVNSLIE